jgi:V-type H+-transporting ATPase subunit H
MRSLLTLFTNSTLVSLLKQSTDPTVLAVAAFDIGQYAKHYERGRK